MWSARMCPMCRSIFLPASRRAKSVTNKLTLLQLTADSLKIIKWIPDFPNIPDAYRGTNFLGFAILEMNPMDNLYVGYLFPWNSPPGAAHMVIVFLRIHSVKLKENLAEIVPE